MIGDEEENVEADQNVPVWEELLQNEEDFQYDADIHSIHVEGCCQKQCSRAFSLDELLELNLDARNLDYMQEGSNILDLFILGQIRCMCRTQDCIKTGKCSVFKERQRQRLKYTLAGETVCERLFLAVNAIKIKRFKRLLKHFKTNGSTPPVHKNFKRTPKKTCSRETLEQVVLFIRNHAEENALFMPGRLANHKVIVKLLPSSDTKKKIFSKYKEVCQKADVTSVGRSLLYKIWKTFCPDVVIMRPRTDLCAFCQKNMTTHAKLRGASEEEKQKFFRKCQEHLELVNAERASYKSIVQKTKDELSLIEVIRDENGFVVPKSYSKSIHYSFDFAQQVHIPFDSQQPGPIYFLTPFKVGLFGIMNDTMKVQHNFLIPESVSISKGANAIVSYLHFFLENHGCGETHLFLHADNCVSQNKNNIMIGYLVWRVLKGLNESITLSFLPVGHTKFSCDWAFGLLKKKFRKSKVSSLTQLENVVKSSTPSGLNQTITTGTENGTVLVPMHDWLSYFQNKNWKACKDITKYAHFHFSTTNMGVVETKQTLEGRTIKNRIACDVTPDSVADFPEQIQPEGMTFQRKKYLYKKIREYCEDEYKDLLCPHPGEEPEENQVGNSGEHQLEDAHAKRPKRRVQEDDEEEYEDFSLNPPKSYKRKKSGPKKKASAQASSSKDI